MLAWLVLIVGVDKLDITLDLVLHSNIYRSHIHILFDLLISVLKQDATEREKNNADLAMHIIELDQADLDLQYTMLN